MKSVLCALALFFPLLCFSEPYIGISQGIMYVDDKYSDDDEAFEVDDKAVSFRIFTGYKWEDKNGWGIATEIAYLYSDSVKFDFDIEFAANDLVAPVEGEGEFDTKAVGGDILFSYKVGRTSPFISVGYYFWDITLEGGKLKDTDVGVSLEGDDFSYGIGTDIQISKRLGMRLEWRQHKIEIGEWDTEHDTFFIGAKVTL